MNQPMLEVRMFGNLSLTLGERTISCTVNRAKRVWMLLAYLLHHRDRVVSSDELLGLIRNEEKESANPAGALKTAMHRVRATLDLLGEGKGHDLLLFRGGGYTWNPEVTLKIDKEEFEALIGEAVHASDESGENASEVSELLVKAVSLYGGEFCSMQSSEPWVIPAAAYYQNLYTEAISRAIPYLEKGGRYEEGITLCRAAIAIDPYTESFYQLLMRCLIAADKRQEVITLYEEMSRLLLSTFGVMPDAESRALYREALKTVNTHVISPMIMQEQLQESDPITGALLCDYDFFKNVYQAKARMLARSGDAIHVVLLTLTGRMGKDLAKRSLELAMDHLEQHICKSLRRGDMVSRCSGTQFVIMLPQASFENANMVCNRFIDSFMRQYPHSPVQIRYDVQAMIPSTQN